jgi:uncharacterized SAM-binding protein YcdF (DUF218 family)
MLAPTSRGRSLMLGLISGMLAGFFLMELGVGRILGDLSLQLVGLVSAAVGVMLAFAGRPAVMLVADAVLFCVFLLIADTPIMSPPAAAWVRDDSLPARADAIVVLSSSINSAGALDDQGVARLLTGLELFQRGIAPRLFTTEISIDFGNVTRTSTVDHDRLVTLGGARSAWTSITGVHTTHDEATEVAARLGRGKTVVVVTAPLHTRRACATFEGVGLTVACAPSREQEYATWHPRTARDRLEAFRQYLYERLGMVKYRAKGWLASG